ncbi:MAG: hypothetical protein MR436_01700 [Eubacterium sp.]|nr:hypothetical protein [Eubacterium sp.]
MLIKMLTGILVGIVVLAVICLFFILIMSRRNKDRSVDDMEQEKFLAEWKRKKQ